MQELSTDALHPSRSTDAPQIRDAGSEPPNPNPRTRQGGGFLLFLSFSISVEAWASTGLILGRSTEHKGGEPSGLYSRDEARCWAAGSFRGCGIVQGWFNVGLGLVHG